MPYEIGDAVPGCGIFLIVSSAFWAAWIKLSMIARKFVRALLSASTTAA